MLFFLALNAKAQDFYFAGYYNVANGTVAALYKNNERLYTAHITGLTSKAVRVACNSQGDVFWLVCHYNYPSNTLNRIEIRKNNQVYASTEGHNEIHISDMYILNDTLYCTGYQLDENGITIATVWKGEDFATHWILGDGIHASVIYNAEMDKNTNTPYFCGYVSDTIQKACVWKASQLLYKQEPSGVQRDSQANEISIDNGEIYTKGYLSYYFDNETISIPTIWKDNEQIYHASALDFVNCLYANKGDYYYTLFYPHGMLYAVYKNTETILELPSNQAGVQRICSDLDDVYMVGTLQGQGCIWKNFEVYLQPNNCYCICDMVVSYAGESIDETDNNGFTVYPNPANNILFVQTLRATSLPAETYRITNPQGQTLLKGSIIADCQQINIESLPVGMYFITMGETTWKFVVE